MFKQQKANSKSKKKKTKPLTVDAKSSCVDNIGCKSGAQKTFKLLNTDQQSILECTLCLNPITNRAVLDPCGHEFDLECLTKWFVYEDLCPFCHTEYKRMLFNIRSESEFDSQFAESPYKLSDKENCVTVEYPISRSARLCVLVPFSGYYIAATRKNRVQLVTYPVGGNFEKLKVVDINPDTPVKLDALKSNVLVRDYGQPVAHKLNEYIDLMESARADITRRFKACKQVTKVDPEDDKVYELIMVKDTALTVRKKGCKFARKWENSDQKLV